VQFDDRKFPPANLQAVGATSHKGQDRICIALLLFIDF